MVGSFALAIFDLDGTLVDSLPDIAAALNRTLRHAGHPPLPAAQIAGYVGDGAATASTTRGARWWWATVCPTCASRAPSAAVTWGYVAREALGAEQPTWLVDAPEELLAIAGLGDGG